MSSQTIVIALMLLVAIAAAAPKGDFVSDSRDKIIAAVVEHPKNPTARATCGGQPTELQCLLCHCTWLNNVCTGTAPTC
uniref:Uncharacterized protein n=1 Tax=Plectus sambesii TaxID=2011161 RepID=A0A914VUC0_9BILA